MRASQLGTLMAIIAGSSGPIKITIVDVKQIYSTNDADPNAASITPTNTGIGNIFYQDAAAPGATGTNFWTWSITNQVWVQFSV